VNFLIDECLHKSLIDVAIARGHQATHVTWRGLAGAADWRLMEPIRTGAFTFVTNNAKDFRRLYAREPSHAGLIILSPQMPPPGQRRLFALALDDLDTDLRLDNQVLDVCLVDGESVIERYNLRA
jgi:predicted nuclease of predicted toxin-antitoxin system